jgi:hypothetical protein
MFHAGTSNRHLPPIVYRFKPPSCARESIKTSVVNGGRNSASKLEEDNWQSVLTLVALVNGALKPRSSSLAGSTAHVVVIKFLGFLYFHLLKFVMWLSAYVDDLLRDVT